jgi:hypothetical protein
VPHEPKALVKDAVAPALESMKKTEKIAKLAATARDNQESLSVCAEMKKDGEFCDPAKKGNVA